MLRMTLLVISSASRCSHQTRPCFRLTDLLDKWRLLSILIVLTCWQWFSFDLLHSINIVRENLLTTWLCRQVWSATVKLSCLRCRQPSESIVRQPGLLIVFRWEWNTPSPAHNWNPHHPVYCNSRSASTAADGAPDLNQICHELVLSVLHFDRSS